MIENSHISAKPPLRPKHVWSIRTKLQIERRTRDLATFNLAIDSKLPGCDLVNIRVEDVAASGYTADRATVRQKKTGRPVGVVRAGSNCDLRSLELGKTGKKFRDILAGRARSAAFNREQREPLELLLNDIDEWSCGI